ncbi:MAG TPA: PPOX class F420-dependent oxidoreductase [Acidimicrobiales bacterium]|nr:PPOX class F420-dependent oxidoreductase [Acidimicrobiales bacterium]
METIPASHRDLLDAQVATLATVFANGRPQQSIVWFLAEGDTVRISLTSSRQKTVNLKRHPACSLLIVDPTGSQRYLEVRGDAQVEADPDYVFAAKLGAKYNADLRLFDPPGATRVVVTILADRVRAVDGGS